MRIDESMINQKVVVEEISAPNQEIQVLESLGIKKGKELIIVGKGYLEGSVVIICDDVMLQLNPYFLKKIQFSNVKEKSK